MRVCVTVEGQEDVTWPQWRALAETCEDAGFEGLFRSDHYASVVGAPRGSLDAWATLAGLAAVTDRLRLGTIVTPVTFRHPSELARVVATVDHVSGGRVELGLGLGWSEADHRAFGFAFPPARERAEMLAEQLEIVHRQWTEDAFDFDGRFYRLDDCRALPKPVQSPHPPILVGGTAKPGTLAPAVRFADEYNTFGASPAACRERRDRIDAACEAAGRDPASLPLSVMAGLVLGRDAREVSERASRTAERLRTTPDELLSSRGDGMVVGAPAEAAAQLRAYAEAGVTRVFLQVWLPDDLAQLELAGGELLPLV